MINEIDCMCLPYKNPNELDLPLAITILVDTSHFHDVDPGAQFL